MKDNLKFKIFMLYFIFYGSLGCFFPFLMVYFKARHMSYTQIGILFAANSVISTLLQPLWGILSDKYIGKKNSMFIAMFASSLIIISFVFVQSFVYVLVALSLFIFFQCPLMSILDSYCCEIIEETNAFPFGHARLMGSIGYAVFALIIGYIVNFSSIYISFYSYILLIIVSTFILKSISYEKKFSDVDFRFSDFSLIFKNKFFMIFVLSSMVLNISAGINGNYIAVLIQKTGGNVSKLGLLWFIIALCELPVLFYGSQIINRLGALNTYFLSIIFFMLRFLLDSFCQNYEIVILVQILQTITFPLFLISFIQIIKDIIPLRALTTAITLFNALSYGFGGFLGNLFGGVFLQYSNIFSLYKVISILCLVSLAIGLPLRKKQFISEEIL